MLGAGRLQATNKSAHDGTNDPILDCEGFPLLEVEPLRPEMIPRIGFHELGRDANSLPNASYAALDDVAYPKDPAHLFYIVGLVPIMERGVTRDDIQLVEPRQLSDDVFGNAVAEIGLRRIAAHIGEG